MSYLFFAEGFTNANGKQLGPSGIRDVLARKIPSKIGGIVIFVDSGFQLWGLSGGA